LQGRYCRALRAPAFLCRLKGDSPQPELLMVATRQGTSSAFEMALYVSTAFYWGPPRDRRQAAPDASV